jgi:hypothetical protein
MDCEHVFIFEEYANGGIELPFGCFKLCDLGHILTRAGLQTKSMWWAVRPDQWSKLFLKVFEPKKRAA